MIYAQSPALERLSYVVMDEVHYLADPGRGPIWEEVILNLPQRVTIAALSATVSNVEEFGRWLTTVRGETAVIVTTERPVPLDQFMLAGSRLTPMFESGSSTPQPGEDAAPNPQLFDDHSQQARRGRRFPDRAKVISTLSGRGMLPAIYFIFSRQGCDRAVAQCYAARLVLTTKAEAHEILEYIDQRVADIPREDLAMMDFRRWRISLSRGVAAHHAGMLPEFRHIVEELFVRGFLRVVFATETLALGINMPARTVVLERLVKFNGESHVDLTPAQYTQLTGRAGRRGIDTQGYAVVIMGQETDPQAVAELAATRAYPLLSTFRPGYNMTVNLLNTLGREGAHEILDRSFAQFQLNRDVVESAHSQRQLEIQLNDLQEERDRQLRDVLGGADTPITATAAGVDPAAQVLEYEALRTELSRREKTARKDRIQERTKEIATFLHRQQPGSVIALPDGKYPPLAVVVRCMHRADPEITVITEMGEVRRLSASKLANVPMEVGTMRLPADVTRHPKRSRSLVRSEFNRLDFDRPRSIRREARIRPDKTVKKLRHELKAHPVHQWPHREELVQLQHRIAELQKQLHSIHAQSEAATGHDSLKALFDRMAELLTGLDYLADDELTSEGVKLARIHHQSDLLIAQCLRRGIWNDLDPAELAAVVATVASDSRKNDADPQEIEVPTARLATAMTNTQRLWDELVFDEKHRDLPPTGMPDPAMATAIHQWTAGAPLSYCLKAAVYTGSKISVGDFVRFCRQVIDVLDQIRATGYEREIRRSASQAVDAIRRGVVGMGTTTTIDPIDSADESESTTE